MLKGKKVLITVSNPLFHDRRMQRIAEALSEQGMQVHIVGVRKNGVPLPDSTKYKSALLKVYFQNGMLFYAELNLRLFFYLLFSSFDLLISVDLDTLLPGRMVSALKNKKLIYDAHEYFTEVPELEGKAFKKWIWGLVARLCIGKNNLTVSQSLVKVLSEKYGKEFNLVRNLPEKSTIEGEVKAIPVNDTINILYIGYLNKGRGLETAIKALNLLPERFELNFIGGGDREDSLKELANKEGVQDRVHFIGWLKPEAFDDHLSKAHIGLNLLENRSQSYYYSLANKTFDYIKYGLPAIHMNFTEYQSLNKEFDIFEVLDSLNPENLAFLLLQLTKDKENYSRLSLNNISAAKELNWENEKEKLIRFVDKVV